MIFTRIVITGMHLLTATAHAASCDNRWAMFRAPMGSCFGDASLLTKLAQGVITFVSGFVAAVCIIAIIWGATIMQGVGINEGNKEEGKKIMITALVGLVWAIAAIAIVQFAAQFFADNLTP